MLPKQSAPRRAMRRFRWQLRTLAGRDIKPRVQLQCEMDDCNASKGGWRICPEGISADAIVYSLGIGQDISWDTYVIERFGVLVHAFDPTPKSLTWLRTQQVPDQLMVHPFGVADFDGEAQFNPPEKSHHVDYTLLDRPSTAETAIRVPVRRLATLMYELGHDRIDLLKMDIEGAEYGVIEDIVQTRLPVRQLLIEFHHRFANVGIEATQKALRQLDEAGYRIFAISDSGQEYSFLHRS